MALFVPDSAPRPEPSQTAQHFVPPSARERRAQAVHRLQVGLFGLAAMVLLVALANIIRNNAAQNEATVVPEAAPTMAAEKTGTVSDPLADAGVVPDTPAAPADGHAAAPPR